MTRFVTTKTSMGSMWPPPKQQLIYILGNSGSLLDLPKQGEWPRDAHVLGTNRILRTGHDGRRYFPDALVLSDARPLETDRELLLDYPGPRICATYLGTDIATHWFESATVRPRYKEQPFPHFHGNRWGDPTWHIGCVAFQCAQLALRMLEPGGKVVLLGCERQWPSKGDPRRARHHFYPDAGLAHRPFQINQGYADRWGQLATWAGEQGFELLSGTPWRDLALPGLAHYEWGSK